MPNVKLKFSGQEIVVGSGVASFGRASDNVAAFPEDSNVSRYHAELERRGEDFWLVDLDSANGTTVNNRPVKGETKLKSGDRLTFGGTSVVVIEIIKDVAADNTPNIPTAANEKVTAEDEEKPAENNDETPAKKSRMPLIAGGAVVLAVVCVAAAGGIYYLNTPTKCEARAIITKPEAGDTILNSTEIEVDVENGACVSKAVFTLDGAEFASTSDKPYTATLDPKQFADLSDGFEHNLQIVLIDKSGNKIVQPNYVALAFETREIAAPTPTPQIAKVDATPIPKTQNTAVSLIDVQNMAKNLVKQYGGNFAYNVSNKQFLAEVQKKTSEYAQAGYYDRAAAFRDQINTAYVREQNLDAPLGFVLAMSRSKFTPAKQGANEGLWQMSNDFVTANAYNGLCGTENLSDASQNCAAKASALYMKALVYGVFDGDAIYSAAAFGKSPQDAGAWKATLPPDRSDVWNSIKTAPEREQLIRFFAAGIVAENPQKFGLKKDKPLSELYKVTM